jgi:tRNA A-37 threonylcarbamoyl transferase component Bud32
VELIASGRASEVFHLGGGRVLRRFNTRGHPEREALVMRHARHHGYPVPEVFEVVEDALVLARIEGPTMWDVVGEDSSNVPVQAALLAQLHQELHEIEAPDCLPAVRDASRLLHLDLHPVNVILSPSGPVVIDWTNARRGDPAFDVAVTWVIDATSSGLGDLGRSFVSHFISHFRRDDLRLALRPAAEYRMDDDNVTKDEQEAIRNLVAAEGV